MKSGSVEMDSVVSGSMEVAAVRACDRVHRLPLNVVMDSKGVAIPG